MQYRLPPMQNQHAFHGIIPPVNQGNALHGAVPDLSPNMGHRNYAMPPASYVGSGYPNVPGLQYPMAYPGGMYGQRPLSSSPVSVTTASANSNPAASSSPGTSSGGQLEGLPSFVLFSCFSWKLLGAYSVSYAIFSLRSTGC